MLHQLENALKESDYACIELASKEMSDAQLEEVAGERVPAAFQWPYGGSWEWHIRESGLLGSPGFRKQSAQRIMEVAKATAI
jgi:hypothetical protein